MKQNTRKAFFVLTTIIISGIIFLFSAQTGAASVQTSEDFAVITLKYLPFLNGQDESMLIMFARDSIFLIRKFAHFIIYFLLGISASSMFFQFQTQKNKSFALAFIYCLVYAISDELHQYFVIGRSARVTDVFIDSAGALCGILVVALFLTWYEKKKSQNKIT